MRSSKGCETCSVVYNFKSLRQYKGTYLCYFCYVKVTPRIPHIGWILSPGRPKNTLEQSLSKVYEVRGTVGKSGQLSSSVHFSHILIGRKFKIVLVGE